MGLGPYPPGSIWSFYSRADTDPGPQQQARSSSPAKSISTSLSSLGVRERTAFFDRGPSPAPGGLGLVHGTRSGSPTGTHWDSGSLPHFLRRNLCHLCLHLPSPLGLVSKSHELKLALDRLVPSNLLNLINRKVRRLF
jgi:hypothetical protein